MNYLSEKRANEVPTNYLKFFSTMQSSEVADLSYRPTNHNPSPPSPFPAHDEIPVKKSQKTFEQLLEEELQKNNENTLAKLKSRKKSSPKYLKRGEGALCTNSRASTPSNTGRFTPAFSGLSTLPQEGFNTPAKTIRKFRKSTSQLNVKKLKTDVMEYNPQVNSEKFVIKPLDLYRIRRDKWKIRESNEDATSKEVEALSRFEDEKMRITTERSNSKHDEISSLKSIIRKLKENERNWEINLKIEAEKYKNQIDELKRQNFKLLQENTSLKQRVEKLTAKAITGNAVVISSRIHRQKKPSSEKPVSSTSESGKKETFYPNGVRRETYPNGYSLTYYTNQDVKQEYPDGKIVYFFAEPQTTQTTYSTGKVELKFNTGQEEVHFPDKSKEIRYVDGTIKYIFANGDEQIVFKDGTVQKIAAVKS